MNRFLSRTRSNLMNIMKKRLTHGYFRDYAIKNGFWDHLFRKDNDFFFDEDDYIEIQEPDLSDIVIPRKVKILPSPKPMTSYSSSALYYDNNTDKNQRSFRTLIHAFENEEIIGFNYSPKYNKSQHSEEIVFLNEVHEVFNVGVAGLITSNTPPTHSHQGMIVFTPLTQIIIDENVNPNSSLRKVKVKMFKSEYPEEEGSEMDELLNAYTIELLNLLREIRDFSSPDFVMINNINEVLNIAENENTEFLCDQLIEGACFSVLNSRTPNSGLIQHIISEKNGVVKIQNCVEELKKELETLKIREKIEKELDKKINDSQRYLYLTEQYKIIGNELGVNTNEKEVLKERYNSKLEGKIIDEETRTVIDEELNKLQTLDPSSMEFNVSRNYLDILCTLPWGILQEENDNINIAESKLNEFHYGLEDLKKRILEFIAISILKGSTQGKILNFVGPPGTGKTSIGMSIAKALGRDFHRFSVGGLNDVSEIKGHRRTYVGAMPGKFIQILKRSNSMNPVIVIDEIDKISSMNNFKGDPSSALLEALDPEQNSSFVDHYLDLPFDLSKVLFITTANTTDTIPIPLLDRMEVIRLSGYILEEKVQIAKQYLIPRLAEESGISTDNISFTDDSLIKLIKGYCRESGVRSLEKKIQKIFRKIALEIVKTQKLSIDEEIEIEEENKVDEILNEVLDEIKIELENENENENENEEEKRKPLFKIDKKYEIDENKLKEFLGNPKFVSDRYYEELPIGTSIGLAWNNYGGSVIYVETIALPKSFKKSDSDKDYEISNFNHSNIHLTGSVGDVMKESVHIAYSYVKKFLFEKYPENKFFENNYLHIHFPEGATKKDGPSAGITIATSLLSLALNKQINQDLGMTGELTLSGKVLPIGGVKEKLIAAKRIGINKVLLPADNKMHLDDLNKNILEGIEIIFVDNFNDVFEHAL